MKGKRKTALHPLKSPVAKSLAAALVLATLATPLTYGAEKDTTEYEVKAAYIIKFIPVIAWPDDTFDSEGSPVILGILGESPVTSELERLAAARSSGREVEVRHLQQIADAADCHILFVGTSLDPEAVMDILDVVAERPVLTVSEIPEFSRKGGIVTFVRRGNKVRFQINHESALRAGLELSSQLLQLAELVQTIPEDESEAAE